LCNPALGYSIWVINQTKYILCWKCCWRITRTVSLFKYESCRRNWLYKICIPFPVHLLYPELAFCVINITKNKKTACFLYYKIQSVSPLYYSLYKCFFFLLISLFVWFFSPFFSLFIYTSLCKQKYFTVWLL
jgi:hypothetical protein